MAPTEQQTSEDLALKRRSRMLLTFFPDKRKDQSSSVRPPDQSIPLSYRDPQALITPSEMDLRQLKIFVEGNLLA